MENSSGKMGALKFFRESVKNLKTVGTITRSSKYLCQAMIQPIDLQHANVVIELGAGDGVLTHYILDQMPPNAKLLSFELNPEFCKQLEQIQDDRLIIVNDDAAKIEEYLNKNGFDKTDAIISALPFTLIPESIMNAILEACKKVLRQDGVFTQMHYSLLLLKNYKRVFGNTKIKFVPLNIPPAWVVISKNKSH